MAKDAKQVELEAKLAALQSLLAEKEALIAKQQEEAEKQRLARLKDITFKVSEKGCLSVYGLGRFPVTLYKQQWLRLLDASDKVREALNNPALSTGTDDPRFKAAREAAKAAKDAKATVTEQS